MAGAAQDKTKTEVKTAQPEIPSWMLPAFQQSLQGMQDIQREPGKYVYQGERVAPLTPGQERAISGVETTAEGLTAAGLPQKSADWYADMLGGKGYLTPEQTRSAFEEGTAPSSAAFRNDPSAFMKGAYQAGQFTDPTAGYDVGSYEDPYARQWRNLATGGQAAGVVSSLASPLFQRMRAETIPALRSQSQLTGQGLTSTRRGLGEQEAMETLGTAMATGAVAPVFTAERGLESQQALADAARYLQGWQTEQEQQAAIARQQSAAAASAYGAATGAEASGYGAQQAAAASMFGAKAAADANLYRTEADLYNAVQQRALTQEEAAQARAVQVYNDERQRQLGAYGQGMVPYQQALGEFAVTGAGGQMQQEQAQRELDARRAAFDEQQRMMIGAAAQIFGITPFYTPTAETTAINKPSSVTQAQQAYNNVLSGISVGMMCWIADALYGEGSPDATLARIGVLTAWPRWARALYRRFGQRLARRPWVVAALRPLFDWTVRRGQRTISRHWDLGGAR